MARVRAGAEVVIESDARAVVVVRPAGKCSGAACSPHPSRWQRGTPSWATRQAWTRTSLLISKRSSRAADRGIRPHGRNPRLQYPDRRREAAGRCVEILERVEAVSGRTTAALSTLTAVELTQGIYRAKTDAAYEYGSCSRRGHEVVSAWSPDGQAPLWAHTEHFVEQTLGTEHHSMIATPACRRFHPGNRYPPNTRLPRSAYRARPVEYRRVTQRFRPTSSSNSNR